MFEFLRGTLYGKGMDYCVVEVSGVGFRINTSAGTLSQLGQAGDQVLIYTYLHVKEDELTLFGFTSREELSVFLMLISVSGVGPKVALAVLSAMSASAFSLAVAEGDHKAICKSKGVGPKLAQRIVLELKDKVTKELKAGGGFGPSEEPEPELTGYVDSDAVSALMVLGYSAKDAAKAVKAVYRDGMPLEETVKSALRRGC